MLCVSVVTLVFFFFKQKTAYEMRISDWSSDVCSSDLRGAHVQDQTGEGLDLDDLGPVVHLEGAEPHPVVEAGPDLGPVVVDGAHGAGRSEERRCRERVCQYV